MATLKISDLSVGDWVNVMAEKRTSLVFCKEIEITRGYIHAQIKDVREDGFIALQTADSRYTLADIGCICPIPITAEILEKNGLCVVEEDANFSEYELFGSENFSLFHTKGTLRYRFETPQASVVCWFVHELQHALRLAGVEKDIIL